MVFADRTANRFFGDEMLGAEVEAESDGYKYGLVTSPWEETIE